MEKTLRIISIMKNAVFTTPYCLAWGAGWCSSWAFIRLEGQIQRDIPNTMQEENWESSWKHK